MKCDWSDAEFLSVKKSFLNIRVFVHIVHKAVTVCVDGQESLWQAQGPYASQLAAKRLPPPLRSAQSLWSASHSTVSLQHTVTGREGRRH